MGGARQYQNPDEKGKIKQKEKEKRVANVNIERIINRN